MVQDGIFEKIRERGHHPRIVLNDADSRIVQLFKVCRDHPELLAYAVAMTPYSRSEHKLAQQGLDEVEDAIEQARKYLVDGWQSFKYENGDVWGIMRRVTNNNGGCTGHEETWNSLPSRILAASPHLQGEPNPIDSLDCLNSVGRSFVQPPTDVKVEMARRYLITSHQGVNGLQPGQATGWSAKMSQQYNNSKEVVDYWNTLPLRILTATEHLKRCYIENDDAVKCIERWASPHTAIYADPPYIGHEAYYKEQDSNFVEWRGYRIQSVHFRLSEVANTCEAACVAVSYYPTAPEGSKITPSDYADLLDELYPEADWERHYRETVASSAGITRNSKNRTRPKRTELLLVRKNRNPEKKTIALSGQISLF